MVGNTNQSFGRQRKNDFDLFKKKESSKKEKKQEVAFEYCIACLVTWPVSISTRVLDVIELSTIPNVSSSMFIYFSKKTKNICTFFIITFCCILGTIGSMFEVKRDRQSPRRITNFVALQTIDNQCVEEIF